MGDILSCFFSFVLIRYILELTGCVTISCFVKFSFEHSYPVFYLKWHFTRKHVRMIWSYWGWHDWNLFHHETHIHYLRLTSEPWGWRWPIRAWYWFPLTNQRPRLVTGVRREREGGWEELSVSLCPSTIHGPKSSNAQTPPQQQDHRGILYTEGLRHANYGKWEPTFFLILNSDYAKPKLKTPCFKKRGS